MKKLLKAIDHNQALSIAVIAAIGLCIWIYGCESTVESIIKPTVKVTRAELNLEVQQEQTRLANELKNLQALAAMKNQKLDRQDEIKQGLSNLALSIATEGKINPLGIAIDVIALLGIGFAVDNRAKDKLIKRDKSIKENSNG